MIASFRTTGFALVLFSLTFATAAHAAAIDYTMTFTLTEGSGPPPTGSFTYDADATLFTNFHVFWQGVDFDVTNATNSPGATGVCGPKVHGPGEAFAMLSGSTICPVEQLWTAHTNDTFTVLSLFASNSAVGAIVDRRRDRTVNVVLDATGVPLSSAGTFTIAQVDAPTAVPEPTTMALVATGLAGVLLRRRGSGSQHGTASGGARERSDSGAA
jgi:hypothetical protein